MESILIIGCGGHARSVADVLEESGKYKIAGYVIGGDEEISAYLESDKIPIIGHDSDAPTFFQKGVRLAAMGIGYLGGGHARERIYARYKAQGFGFPPVVSPTAVLSSQAFVGEGSFVGKQAIMNRFSQCGALCIINSGAVLEHDVRVEACTHVSVRATICGGSHIGASCFIGAGATVIQGVRIGTGAIIGAGSVVLADVPENTVKVGVVTCRETNER